MCCSIWPAVLTSPTISGKHFKPRVMSCKLARAALSKLPQWDIQPMSLSAVELTIAERFAGKLMERRLLPENECNDALILAEASLAAIPLLVTSDKHLLDMDEDT
jgi:hypothetical protein